MLMTVPSAPLISIISVTRDDASGLKTTGESVAQQTFDDVEWIVSDGDSHDATKVLMEGWEACPVTFLSQRDRSIYEGMNNGAVAATGRWLHFLNSGDAFSEPTTLERVAQILTETGRDWGFGAVRNLRPDGSGFSMQCASPFDPRGVALGNTTIPHQGTFVRRELFESLSGFLIDFGTEADQEFIYRLTLRGTPFEVVWPIADVRMGGTGWSGGTGHFPRAMRRARRAHGAPIGGNWIVDSVATGAVLGKSYWTKVEGLIANRLRG
jgi:glycosyltransferase involved in cell wall biosynthesis